MQNHTDKPSEPTPLKRKFEDPYCKPGPARGGSAEIPAWVKYKRDPDRTGDKNHE